MSIAGASIVRPQRSMLPSMVAQFVVILAIPYVYFSEPVAYVRLITEDNWGENATWVALLLSSYLFAAQFAMSEVRMRGFWYFLLAAVTFMIAMEEISWGQRIFSISTPEPMRQVNFQGEIGLHNIRAISPDELTYQIVSAGLVLYGLILPALVVVSRRVRGLVEFLNLPLPSLHLSPLFLATAFFLSLSDFLYPLAKSDEIGEMLMGLSMASLSVDSARRTLRSRADEPFSPLVMGALVGLVLLWILVAQFAAPRLIEAAYEGDSLPFLNEMLSGRATQSLAEYQEKWLRGSWIVFGLLSLCTVAAIVMRRLPRWIGVDAPERIKSAAIPSIIVVSLTLGVLLTPYIGSSQSLDTRLNEFVRTSLPALGRGRQAELILRHLESRYPPKSIPLLISKGLLATRLGRQAEARTALTQAVELQVEQYNTGRKDPESTRKIATIYSYMGDVGSARQYWMEALAGYEGSLRDEISNERRIQIRLSRGEVYEALELYDAALAEYIAVSDLAPNARQRLDIESGIARILSACASAELTASNTIAGAGGANEKPTAGPKNRCNRESAGKM